MEDLMLTSMDSDAGSDSESPRPSRTRRIGRILGWSGLFLFLLVLFTLIKMPGQKINGYVQSEIARQASSMGLSFTSQKGSLTLFAPGYEFEGVSIAARGMSEPVRLDRLKVSPALLRIITGKLAARVTATAGDGKIHLSGSAPATGSGPISGSFDLSNLDLGKLGLFGMLANGLQGTATASGQATLSGDPADPKSLNGAVDLKLSKIVINEQTFMGFKIPKLTIADAQADLSIENGKAVIRTLRLGKQGAQDDLFANFTGDISLAPRLDNPQLNLKVRFGLSDRARNAFTLLDAILGMFRQSDGSYAARMSGPMSSPAVSPGT